MKWVFRIIDALPKSARRRLFVAIGLARRAMTLGVKILVRDDEGRVLLVRHTYVKGWHFPGGGVERGETAIQAARKELLEECGIEAVGDLQLMQIFRNPITSRFDHVVLYACPEWRQTDRLPPELEIAEVGFFAPDDLPAGTTEPTQARLAELLHGQPVREIW